MALRCTSVSPQESFTACSSERDEILRLALTSTADCYATAPALGFFASPWSNTASVTFQSFVVSWKQARTRAWHPVLFSTFFASHIAPSHRYSPLGAADTHVRT